MWAQFERPLWVKSGRAEPASIQRRSDRASTTKLDSAKLYREHPHLIAPMEVGLDDDVTAYEAILFQRKDCPEDRGTPAILRQYLIASDGSGLVLTQARDDITPITVGETALVFPPGRSLEAAEQLIVNNIASFWQKFYEAGDHTT